MQEKIPFVLMRGGSSRAGFFMEGDLPGDPEIRDRVLLAAFGSPDPNGRQIDGIGGAVSSTSKVAIISKSKVPGTDINYKFGQVSVQTPFISYAGNCGNISAAVGPYAVDEGLVPGTEPITQVRIWQENTKKIIVAEVPVKDRKHLTEGDYAMDGVPGRGAKITLRFLDPAGSITNKLLPTGKVKEVISVARLGRFTVSIIDAGNAVVFVRADELHLKGTENELPSQSEVLQKLETIRSHAAVLMGVAASPGKALPNVPFIAFVTEAKEYRSRNNELVGKKDVDFVARMISMGDLHGAFPGTGAICVAGAARIKGSVVNDLLGAGDLPSGDVRIGHPSGVISVRTFIRRDEEGVRYVEASMGRTARRLAEGYVLVPEKFFSKLDPTG